MNKQQVFNVRVSKAHNIFQVNRHHTFIFVLLALELLFVISIFTNECGYFFTYIACCFAYVTIGNVCPREIVYVTHISRDTLRYPFLNLVQRVFYARLVQTWHTRKQDILRQPTKMKMALMRLIPEMLKIVQLRYT